MTSQRKSQNYGPPPPITELTVEQDLQMRLLEDKLNSGNVRYQDLVTVFLAMQRQNFVMGNSIKNLIKQWPPPQIQSDPNTIREGLPMFGILLENRD